MKTRILFLLFILISCSDLAVAANVNLDRLAKEQQRNDDNALQENKVEKKDVFSTESSKVIYSKDFPRENVCYNISNVAIENDFLNNSETRDFKKMVSGKCLGVKGIEQAVVILQDIYINAGFVTTRVETPAQDLATKTLTLAITPGRIEEITIENDDINTWILPFGKGDILNLRNIEQGLENLQKVPGTDVKINIVPSEMPGYSNVAINVQRTKNWSVRATYNNWGDEHTGRYLGSATGFLYNPVGISDLFYIAGNGSTTGGYQNVSAYYSFPFGFWDYEFFYSSSSSRQALDFGFFSLDYTGKNQYFSAKGSRTLYRDGDKKITGSAELLRRKSTYKLDDISLALQERDMGNIRFGVNYKQNYDDAVLDTTLRWQRFLTWFGGEQTPDMIYGNVSTESEIWSLDANYQKWISVFPVPGYVDIRLGAQYSHDILTLQDQFSIGSRWNVRGFENSSGIDGDKGFYLQNTLGFPISQWYATFYLGADYGVVFGNSNSQASSGAQTLMGSVAGVKGNIESLAYDLSVSAPVVKPDDLPIDDFILNFNVAYHF